MELWVCIILGTIIGVSIGAIVWMSFEGKKRALVSIAVAVVCAILVSGGMYYDTMKTAEKWNGGYCPECEIHWTPFGVSDTDLSSKTKYYYCENCYKEIEL